MKSASSICAEYSTGMTILSQWSNPHDSFSKHLSSLCKEEYASLCKMLEVELIDVVFAEDSGWT